jgi:hypothetical protein
MLHGASVGPGHRYSLQCTTLNHGGRAATSENISENWKAHQLGPTKWSGHWHSPAAQLPPLHNTPATRPHAPCAGPANMSATTAPATNTNGRIRKVLHQTGCYGQKSLFYPGMRATEHVEYFGGPARLSLPKRTCRDSATRSQRLCSRPRALAH